MMENTTNIYCDESCHLPNDNQKAMILGAIWCPKTEVLNHHRAIAQLKTKYQLSPFFEIKWTKVSLGKLEFYSELVNYFFNNRSLAFRAWVVPDKTILSHNLYLQTHDDWYYKMYFYFLRPLTSTNGKYHIYLDIKDTRSRMKLSKLREVLCNAQHDFSGEAIERIQHVHSHDIGLMQLADLIIGAVSYHARNLSSSSAKNDIVKLIKDKSGLNLTCNTPLSEQKFNLCIWRPNNNGGFESA